MMNMPCEHPDWWEQTIYTETRLIRTYCTACDQSWEQTLHPTRKPSQIITIDEEKTWD